MEKMAARQRFKIPDMAASKRFGRYKDEEKRVIRETDIQETGLMGQLMEALKKSHELGDLGESMHDGSGGSNTRGTYVSLCYPFLCDIDFRSGDIARFALTLAELDERDILADFAGCFISAMINMDSMRRYDIPLGQLGFITSNIGNMNRALVRADGNAGDSVARDMDGGILVLEGDAGDEAGAHMQGGALIIRGDAGRSLGEHMEGGVIIVDGNAGHSAGFLSEGGLIVIKGDAGDDAGWSMAETGNLIIFGNSGDYTGKHLKDTTFLQVFGDAGDMVGIEMEKDGRIWIRGNAGEKVGEKMNGGEIRIDGEIGSIGRVIHGQIYHKGKLIVDK